MRSSCRWEFPQEALDWLVILISLLTEDSAMFQTLAQGHLPDHIFALSGPITAIYYILVELYISKSNDPLTYSAVYVTIILADLRVIYNLWKFHKVASNFAPRDLTAFIRQCMVAAAFFVT